MAKYKATFPIGAKSKASKSRKKKEQKKKGEKKRIAASEREVNPLMTTMKQKHVAFLR